MIFRDTIVLLCGVGLYASAFMYRKSRRAARGELAEPSVVQTPNARALGGVSNALVGLAYYAALACASHFFEARPVWLAAFAASVAAAAFSCFLAYSLAFVTRMPCAYCWTSHIINWTLPFFVWMARP